MGVSLEQYRACIGLFNSLRFSKCFFCTRTGLFHFFSSISGLFHVKISSAQYINFQYFYVLFNFCVLLLSWDIELNPGPRDYEKSLSVCHWNLNSVWVDDFSKITQLSAFLNVHNFDIVCLGETFLTSHIMDDDPRLAIEGYEILRSDHPSDSRRGGVCVFYKDHLSLVGRPELTSLDECLVCEIKTGANRFLLCLCYRSPSQNQEQFANFAQNWEEKIINISDCSPTVSVFIGDFNAKILTGGPVTTLTLRVRKLVT